jgi:hypothetical protein
MTSCIRGAILGERDIYRQIGWPMTAKRIPLSRDRRFSITPEMIDLFRRGLKLLADGKEGSDEFREIDKRLNWTLLHRPGDVSVFDRDLDGRMPGYMAHLASGDGWPDSVALRKALMQAAGDGR